MTDSPAYQVLARKYRPETFADLVGQDAMVRILRNAFAADRIAQAFVLTGIRGTGKTTTARIIAKGLNCTGPDGQGQPTTDPCGLCDNCAAISQGRHVDVLEMDAASHTGVQNIRDTIIETVAYAPVAARFKVFIIDEVHMLSTSAFNALLKTLEEPPRHVKFIFATTEIRKVPVTVLSRCQRFDLRRIEPETMIAMLSRIAAAEGATIGDDALALITRAAEGSARDAQSLLDQAISHGAGETTAEQVRAMLGLADRGRIMDLFDLIMKGDAAGALGEVSQQYADGADPLVILRDLAEVTHWISVAKVTPEAVDDPTVSPDERARGQAMAAGLGLKALARMWQMLLKALDEVGSAPNTMMAAEMAVIRMTHVADMPSPEELLRRLAKAPGPEAEPGSGSGTGSGPGMSGGQDGLGGRGASGLGGAMGAGGTAAGAASGFASGAGSGPTALGRAEDGRGNDGSATDGSALGAPGSVSPGSVSPGFGTPGHGGAQAQVATAPDPLGRFASFASVVDLIRANRDIALLLDVERGVKLARYAPGRIEFEPAAEAPRDLAQRLGQRLQVWTGARWAVSVVADGGAPTIDAQRNVEEAGLRAAAADHPLVRAVFAAFPGAEIARVTSREDLERAAQAEALEAGPDSETEALPDDWTPFDAD